MLELNQNGFFEENFNLFGAVYDEKSIMGGDHQEISKNDFVMMLKEAGILIKPKAVKAEDGKGDKKGGAEKKEDDASKAQAP